MPSFFRILTVIFLALYACLLIFITANAKSVLTQGNDYQAQYTAARLVGEHKSVYNLQNQLISQQRSVSPSISYKTMVPFIASPVAIVWLAPLGAFTFQTSYLVWTSIQYVTLLVLLWLVVKTIRLERGGQREGVFNEDFLLLAMLVFHPTIIALFSGQFSLILVCVMFASYLLFQKKKDLWAGALLATLLIKPYLLLFPILMLVYKKRWRSIGGVLLGATFFLTLTLWVVGVKEMMQYLPFAKGLFWIGNEPMKIHLSRQIGVRALVFVAMGKASFTWYEAVVWGALSLLSIGATAILTKRTKHILARDWALVALGTVFVSPHIHGHDGLILLFPAVAWYTHSPQPPWVKATVIMLAILTTPFLLFYAGYLTAALIMLVYGYLLWKTARR